MRSFSPRRRGRCCASILLAAAALTVAPAVLRARTPAYEEPPISYSATEPNDPVAAIRKAIEAGRTPLPHEPKHGYLDAVLRELKIPVSSQVLVFSRTSFQPAHISPRRPRALYFNDDTYVGYIPEAELLEIVSVDPVLGATFYTIDQSAPDPRARLVRQTDNCLQCHGESMTRNVPGLLVRSVFADDEGHPILPAGTFLTTHESPLTERWGGWYVTGSTGAQLHMGNTRWRDNGLQDPQPVKAPPRNIASVSEEVDAAAYPTPHSDVVALMVLEHQVEAHNRITRAVHGTLRALRDEKIMQEALGESATPGVHSESTLRRIKSSCEPLVEYLLFADEAPLTDAVKGSSDFAAGFAARGRKDSRGRSLRDFDLKNRLFRYPCSYLIESDAMEKLPEPAKQYVHRRLWEILTGSEPSAEHYAHLAPADRAAILEILRDTNPALRAAWDRLEQAHPSRDDPGRR